MAEITSDANYDGNWTTESPGSVPGTYSQFINQISRIVFQMFSEVVIENCKNYEIPE